MATIENAANVVEEIRKVRQTRLFTPEAVPDDVLQQLLEVARWTGSARNTQPWQMIVVTDKQVLGELASVRLPIAWVADVPLAIAIVLDGKSSSELYDEGRMTERLLVAAHMLGLSGGTAWFGDAEQQAQGRKALGVPDSLVARSVVAIGYAQTHKDHRPNPAQAGRRPLVELVSYQRFKEK